MTSTARFKISLRITHPKARSDDITERLGLVPRVSYSVGDRRTTPKGTELEGFRAQTFWSYQWPAVDPFEDAIANISNQLLEKRDFLLHLSETGGQLEYFIGWFTKDSSGFVLESGLLGVLSDLNINLAFDIYADD